MVLVFMQFNLDYFRNRYWISISFKQHSITPQLKTKRIHQVVDIEANAYLITPREFTEHGGQHSSCSGGTTTGGWYTKFVSAYTKSCK